MSRTVAESSAAYRKRRANKINDLANALRRIEVVAYEHLPSGIAANMANIAMDVLDKHRLRATGPKAVHPYSKSVVGSVRDDEG